MRAVLSVAAALVTLMGPAVALAQQAEEPVIGGDAAAPAQGTGDAWASRCVSGTRQGPLECTLSQRAVTKQGQLVGSVTIQLPAGAAPVMIVSVPLGIFLGAGITYAIDANPPKALELQTCDRTACYAETGLPAELITAMQGGQKLNITFQNMQKQPVTLPMSLIGFTAAFDKAK